MLKMKHADAKASFTHDGKTYAPDKSGIITVPGDVVPHATAHGFTQAEEEAEQPKKKKAGDE